MPPGALGGASPHPGGPSEHHSALIWPLGWFNTPGGTHSIARAEPSLRQLLVVEPLQVQFAPRSGHFQELWFCPIRKYMRWTSRISKGMPIFEITTPNGQVEVRCQYWTFCPHPLCLGICHIQISNPGGFSGQGELEGCVGVGLIP